MMRMMRTFGLGLLRTTLKQNLLVAALLGALAFTTTVSRAADPLPSWNAKSQVPFGLGTACCAGSVIGQRYVDLECGIGRLRFPEPDRAMVAVK